MHVTMQAAVLVATKAADPAVSAGLKWGAIGSGLGLLVILYLVVAAFSHHWKPNELVNGFDGFSSTSKFQWFLWLVFVIFGYTAIWVLRAEQGNFSALNEIPVNILTVLGFSTGTAAAAKGITSGYVQTGRVQKPSAATQPNAKAEDTGGIFQDDTGTPELAKIQMMGFTFIAIGIFLITTIHQIVSNDVTAGLPNIDSSLMVLMGISQGGYLGKKLVTSNPLTLYAPNPPKAAPSAAITLPGANLGTTTGQLTLDGTPIETTSWEASSIGFDVPPRKPADNSDWPATSTVQLAVSVMGQTSNTVPFTIAPPPATQAPATQAPAVHAAPAQATAVPAPAVHAAPAQATAVPAPAVHAAPAQATPVPAPAVQAPPAEEAPTQAFRSARE
jgi:hypothetical protein